MIIHYFGCIIISGLRVSKNWKWGRGAIKMALGGKKYIIFSLSPHPLFITIRKVEAKCFFFMNGYGLNIILSKYGPNDYLLSAKYSKLLYAIKLPYVH